MMMNELKQVHKQIGFLIKNYDQVDRTLWRNTLFWIQKECHRLTSVKNENLSSSFSAYAISLVSWFLQPIEIRKISIVSKLWNDVLLGNTSVFKTMRVRYPCSFSSIGREGESIIRVPYSGPALICVRKEAILFHRNKERFAYLFKMETKQWLRKDLDTYWIDSLWLSEKYIIRRQLGLYVFFSLKGTDRHVRSHV